MADRSKWMASERLVRPKRHRVRLVWSALLGAALTGILIGSVLLTIGVAQAAKDLMLSLDGPIQVSQQSPYPANSVITKDDLDAKYHIWLLTQSQATGHPDAAGEDHDWTQTELHTLDANLANSPPRLYAKVNGFRLSFFIGSLTGSSGDVPGGICQQNCDGLYEQSFLFGGGLIGLDQNHYDIHTEAFDQTIIDHELTHRRHQLIAARFDAEVKTILAGSAYARPSDLIDPALPDKPGHTRAGLALTSLAGVSSEDPHVNFEEGVAETAEIYLEGYRAFMAAFGPELNGAGTKANPQSVRAELLAATFPQADALYRLWQDQVFDGFGYDQQRALVPGSAAIPPQMVPGHLPQAVQAASVT